MRQGKTIVCIIPALNEAGAIGKVVAGVPSWVDRVIVADNGSSDGTGDIARGHGAEVIREAEPGYGAACLAGLSLVERADMRADVIVFLDGDFSDDADEMGDLVDPILARNADLVLGSRVLGARQPGALTPQQMFGNWLATRLIKLIWGVRFTDLGPFRAIDYQALKQLDMQDRNFGWTVEMQVKAAETGLKSLELPVRYRKRIGVSKVSGTLRGSVLAGYKILAIIARRALMRRGQTVARRAKIAS